MKKYILLTVSFLSMTAFSQTSLQVKTKWDQYELQRSGPTFTLAGQAVKNTHLEPLLTILKTKATAPCPEKFQTQVTVTANHSGQQVVSRINLDQGILQSSEGCLTIQGAGLEAFPVHRKWLVGPFQKTLTPKKSLALQGKGADFKVSMTDEEWVLSQPNPTFNYEFLEQFNNSLRDFRIDRFILLSGIQNKPQIKINIDGNSFTAFQVAPTTWALKEGSEAWAMISPNWSNWKDLDQSQWTDPHGEKIQGLLSATESEEKRSQILEQLGGSWSESLKRAYQACLHDDSISSAVRLTCLTKMKQRPTQSNFKAVYKMISKTDDEALLQEGANFLRIKNPKGPKYTSQTNLDDFRREWTSWWTKNNR